MHMSLSWEKQPRRHSDQATAMALERGTVHKPALLWGWTRAAPSFVNLSIQLCSHAWLSWMAQGMHSCHSKSTAHGQGGLLHHPMGEDSVPAIPHLRAVKMPLWESKRKIKGKPEQGIALSEVTTFIVTFVLHRLVHHRGFFIPSSFSW